MSILLEFEKLHNIRDLGGMKAYDGQEIKSGCFIRSGHLAALTVSDKEKLSSLINTVVDFRSDKERLEKPDVVIDGVEYIHIPIIDSLTAGVTREKEADKNIIEKLAVKPEEAKKYMRQMYRGFVNDSAVSQYSKFIRLLIDGNDKTFLWHCTAGKDRAGIASVIVEEILGCSRKDIIDDYMSTNKYLESDIEFLTNFVKNQIGTESEMADEALRYLFGAEEEYIEDYYLAVEEKYGDFNRFIHDGLKLIDKEIDMMKKKYLVK